jgi:hypothetical protein
MSIEKKEELKKMFEEYNLFKLYFNDIKRILYKIEHYAKVKNSYNFLIKQDNDEHFKHSIKGSMLFLEDLHKINVFTLFETITKLKNKKNNLKKEYRHKYNKNQSEEIFKLIECIYNDYIASIDDLNQKSLEENKEEFLKNFFKATTTSDFMDSIININTYNKKINFFNFPYRMLKVNILSKFYVKLTDKAIQFLTLREIELIKKYELMYSRKEKVSNVSLILYSKLFQFLIEKDIK